MTTQRELIVITSPNAGLRSSRAAVASLTNSNGRLELKILVNNGKKKGVDKMSMYIKNLNSTQNHSFSRQIKPLFPRFSYL